MKYIMVFQCQKDSYLKKFTTKVISCKKTIEPIIDYGKTVPFEGYVVTLEDTILFPAGGGQPSDCGKTGGKDVVQVIRKGEEALHFVTEPLEVGATVNQTINWERRFDHMQQHSGQHLLSAILEKEHNLPTTSWWLGSEESYVELESTKITENTLKVVEDRCNELIRQALPMTVKFYSSNDPELDKAHTRGLPTDHAQTLRIISIAGVDDNMCCGTHVSNLSQLQTIKLLSADSGKKGKFNLRFLVGNRVIQQFQNMLNREKALTGLLNNAPLKHEELIQKLQKNMKIVNKNLQIVLMELAEYEVKKAKSLDPKPQYLIIYKKEGNADFIRRICLGLQKEGVFLLLAADDPERRNEGQIIIVGEEDDVNGIKEQVMELLKAKGVFKNGKLQGKALNMNAVEKCKTIIEEYFAGKR